MDNEQAEKLGKTSGKVILLVVGLTLIAGLWMGCSNFFGSSKHYVHCRECNSKAAVVEQDDNAGTYMVRCDASYCKAYYTVYHKWTDTDEYYKK